MLTGLSKSGLLKKDYENKYDCSAQFADYLCYTYFATDPDFAQIATYFLSPKESRYGYYYWQERNNPSVAFKKMRLAGYLGKVKLFEEHYYSTVSYTHLTLPTNREV